MGWRKMVSHKAMSYPLPQIGFYQAECCLSDLYKIETQQDLDDALDRIKENDKYGPLMVFPTLAEAITKLRGSVCTGDEISELKRLGWVDA
jgi:hypothetical protein